MWKQSTFISAMEQHVLLGLLWAIYCLLHSLFASVSFKQKAKGWLANYHKYYRVYYTIFAFVTFAAILYYQIQLPSPLLLVPTTVTYVIGAVVSLSGLGIMFICIKKYFLSLSGLKSLITEKPTHTLMISGIHKYVRHPLYLGTFIFIWGLLLVLPHLSLLISNIIITGYTLYGISLEEEKLILEFGQDYKNYKQEVPMLIPLWKKK